MNRRTKMLCVAATVAVLAVPGYLVLQHELGASAYADASSRDFDAKTVSTDLEADLRAMWETEPMRSGQGEASTLPAILAASRVFNSVSLVGKTGAEVTALLGSPVYSSQSIYRGAPFWDMRSRGMCYRFDCGSFGWEFHVYCQGDDASVTGVDRHWIH